MATSLGDSRTLSESTARGVAHLLEELDERSLRLLGVCHGCEYAPAAAANGGSVCAPPLSKFYDYLSSFVEAFKREKHWAARCHAHQQVIRGPMWKWPQVKSVKSSLWLAFSPWRARPTRQCARPR
eukprot:7389501-Prymnesium_polylepis.1